MGNRTFIALACVLALGACNKDEQRSDASGMFEATETIVSSEASGKIMALAVDEGDQLKAGQVLGYVDSTQLHLQKLQLLQSRKAVLSGQPDIRTQLAALEDQLQNAITDKGRIENLVKGNVASQKQLDDANTRIAVLRSQIAAQQNALRTTSTTITEQGGTIGVQLQQVEDQLAKCRITSPVDGTVLATYSNPFEMTAVGRPLFKMADLTTVYLKAYITGDQFQQVKLGQAVQVLVDSGDGGSRSYSGVVDWISDQAEFTPKTIQTKNERANLVYAIKVKVKNDGLIKIGMYGEVVFAAPSNKQQATK
ncbi:MAG: efflux RND transporter periplasmic adaptor subunit [Flavobacteriales bacterium]|jgi:HlyD family secretion protein|nr:efflux RND transporter periplasmic adaptor subunit [Flavobacteriales bacterium]